MSVDAALPHRHRRAILPGKGGIGGALSDLFWRRPKFLLFLMLTPPLLWLGIVYLGSLLALLLQSFFSIDEFSGLITREFTLKTYGELLQPANLDIIVRTVTMAALVTLAAAVVAFPIAYFAARYARGKWKALFYLGVMLPLWSSYLVKIYAWKLILAKEGILTWLFGKLHLSWLLDAWLSLPVVGGTSLSISFTGTFIVFVYVWLPFMILPMQAALERVPANLVEASADLGASPGQTFRKVIFPLALPGIVAGSIFTFSLTLGDYIIPQIIGTSRLFIGQAVYAQQGTAGNIPLAAAFTVVPIVIMGFYLWSPSGWGRSMRSDRSQSAPLGLKIAAAAGLLFLHLPILLIFLYAFTTEEKSYQFPPPGLTTAVVRGHLGPAGRLGGADAVGHGRGDRHGDRAGPRHALRGRRLAARSSSGARRSRCWSSCRSRCPASSPASRCARPSTSPTSRSRSGPSCSATRPSASWSSTTTRSRASAAPRGSLIEASMDLGADGFQTFRHVILPNIGTALLAGGMLAFALSFDEVIVTTFTAGQQQTLPIWMLEELVRPRQRPVTNVVAMFVMLVTLLPILAAYYLTRDGDQIAGAGK